MPEAGRQVGAVRCQARTCLRDSRERICLLFQPRCGAASSQPAFGRPSGTHARKGVRQPGVHRAILIGRLPSPSAGDHQQNELRRKLALVRRNIQPCPLWQIDRLTRRPACERFWLPRRRAFRDRGAPTARLRRDPALDGRRETARRICQTEHMSVVWNMRNGDGGHEPGRSRHEDERSRRSVARPVGASQVVTCATPRAAC